MVNRLIICNALILLLFSALQGSEFAAPTRKPFNKHPKKEALIKKIFLYCSFNKLLDVDNSNDDLFLITQLIGKGRSSNFETLNSYFEEENLKKKNSEQIKCDEKFLSNLIQALYCLSWSEENIDKMKNIGKKIVRMAHPDKGYFDSSSTTSTKISEFLINNICGDSLHNLFENKKHDINRVGDTIITNNRYTFLASKFFGNTASQIGYEIGTKMMRNIIPTDKRSEYITCRDFITKSQVNNLIVESELSKYPQRKTTFKD
jgi:hypothetical protein